MKSSCATLKRISLSQPPRTTRKYAAALFKFAVRLLLRSPLGAFAHLGMPVGHPEVAHPNRTLFELITADIAAHRGDTGFAYEVWMTPQRKTKNRLTSSPLAWEAACCKHAILEAPLPRFKVWVLDSDPAARSAADTACRCCGTWR